MKKILIFILFSVVLTSCDSTNDPIINNSEPVEKYFPLKIGNTWEYLFTTEVENAIIERIIKNNITHEDGSNIWGYTEAVKVINPDPNEPIVGYNTFKTDELYFYSSDKDTMFPGTDILCRKQLLLKSPVNVGTQWETTDGYISRIANIGEIIVLDTSYPNTVLVISEKNQSIDSSWYSLNIGLVKRILNNTGKWELRNYSLLE